MQCLGEESARIREIGGNRLAVLRQGLHDLVRLQRLLMIEMHKERILNGADVLYLLAKRRLIEELCRLNADFRILIRVKGRDTGLRGTEGLACESRLLVTVL